MTKSTKKNAPIDYREVVFQDMPTGEQFIIRSTANTRETTIVSGKTYPLVKLEVSAASHPFYTGSKQRTNEAGRIEKFRRKYGQTSAKTGNADSDATPAA